MIQKQYDILKGIEANIVNFSKDGKERKNKEEYFIKRIDNHKKIIAQFELNHTLIKSFDAEGTDYVNNVFIETLREKGESHMATLPSGLASLKNSGVNIVANAIGDMIEDEKSASTSTGNNQVVKINSGNVNDELEILKQQNQVLSEENGYLKKEKDDLTNRLNRLRNSLLEEIERLDQENTRQIKKIRELEDRLRDREDFSRYEQRRFGLNSTNNEQYDNDSFKLRDIIRMIPKYGGKREELRVYINKIEELWSYVEPGPSQATFISILKNNLFDEAALLFLDEQNLDTWEDIKELLQKICGTDPNYSNNLALLEGMRQDRF